MIELRNHPAQARHPITQEPLLYDDGKPVPLITDQRSIYLDGYMVGYCHASGSWIAFIRDLPEAVQDEIRKVVTDTLGAVQRVNTVPTLAQRTIDELDDDEQEGTDDGIEG